MMSLKGGPWAQRVYFNRTAIMTQESRISCLAPTAFMSQKFLPFPALVSKAVKTFYSFRKNLLKILSDCREGAREVA